MSRETMTDGERCYYCGIARGVHPVDPGPHPDNGCPYVSDDESDMVLADYGMCCCGWFGYDNEGQPNPAPVNHDWRAGRKP